MRAQGLTLCTLVLAGQGIQHRLLLRGTQVLLRCERAVLAAAAVLLALPACRHTVCMRARVCVRVHQQVWDAEARQWGQAHATDAG